MLEFKRCRCGISRLHSNTLAGHRLPHILPPTPVTMAGQDVMSIARGMVLNKSVRLLQEPQLVESGAGSITWTDLPIHPMPRQRSANYFTHLLEVYDALATEPDLFDKAPPSGFHDDLPDGAVVQKSLTLNSDGSTYTLVKFISFEGRINRASFEHALEGKVFTLDLTGVPSPKVRTPMITPHYHEQMMISE